MKRPLVSVALITYNQEKYIEIAIKSVLMQKVNFNYEFLIADDESDDGTSQILDQYQSRYSDVITVIHRQHNLGMNRNANELFGRCKGKYIAYLEGDDFWKDDLKLQKQVEYLETHSGAMATAHNVLCIDENGNKLPKELVDFPYRKQHKYGKKEAMNLEEFGHMSSLVFRNFRDILTSKQWKIYNQSSLNGDFKLGITLGMLGYIYFFEETWSCRRRVFSGTSWTAMTYGTDPTHRICANYFKARQYIQLAFHENVDLSSHFSYLLRRKAVMTVRDFSLQNIYGVEILAGSYLRALEQKMKDKYVKD